MVHASDPPKGRGFSPLVWQVLEGIDDIPLSMITMAEGADEGDIVMSRMLSFGGHELNEEMRDAIGDAIVQMCLELCAAPLPPKSRAQQGEPTRYSRRRAADSQLDPDRSIAEQFALLRVVDNERYPAFFDLHGHRYILKIKRADNAGGSDAEG